MNDAPDRTAYLPGSGAKPGLQQWLSATVAAVLGFGLLAASLMFVGFFLFAGLALAAVALVSFRVWRLFRKPDPAARQAYFLGLLARGMNGPSAASGGKIIDGEAEELAEPSRPSRR